MFKNIMLLLLLLILSGCAGNRQYLLTSSDQIVFNVDIPENYRQISDDVKLQFEDKNTMIDLILQYASSNNIMSASEFADEMKTNGEVADIKITEFSLAHWRGHVVTYTWKRDCNTVFIFANNTIYSASVGLVSSDYDKEQLLDIGKQILLSVKVKEPVVQQLDSVFLRWTLNTNNARWRIEMPKEFAINAIEQDFCKFESPRMSGRIAYEKVLSSAGTQRYYDFMKDFCVTRMGLEKNKIADARCNNWTYSVFLLNNSEQKKYEMVIVGYNEKLLESLYVFSSDVISPEDLKIFQDIFFSLDGEKLPVNKNMVKKSDHRQYQLTSGDQIIFDITIPSSYHQLSDTADLEFEDENSRIDLNLQSDSNKDIVSAGEFADRMKADKEVSNVDVVEFAQANWHGDIVTYTRYGSLNVVAMFMKSEGYSILVQTQSYDYDKEQLLDLAKQLLLSIKIISPRVEIGENKKIIFFLYDNWWTFPIPLDAEFSMLSDRFCIIFKNGESECNIALKRYESAVIARERCLIMEEKLSSVSKRFTLLLKNEMLGNWNTAWFCNDEENKGYKEIIGLAYYKDFVIVMEVDSDNPISPDDLKQYKTMIENLKLGH